MRTAFESVSTMLTPIKNNDESKDREITEEFVRNSHSVSVASSGATVKIKREVNETDASKTSSIKFLKESVNIPGFMDYDPKETMKSRDKKKLVAGRKTPGMMFEYNISPDNVWYDLN